MIESKRREDRWQHLVTAASLLESGGRLDDLLDSALEVFPPSIDPVDDFEGYAVRRFVHAVRGSLESRERVRPRR